MADEPPSLSATCIMLTFSMLATRLFLSLLALGLLDLSLHLAMLAIGLVSVSKAWACPEIGPALNQYLGNHLDHGGPQTVSHHLSPSLSTHLTEASMTL